MSYVVPVHRQLSPVKFDAVIALGGKFHSLYLVSTWNLHLHPGVFNLY